MRKRKRTGKVTAMTVKCKSDEQNCPFIAYCLARLNDPTITGCGFQLWLNGVISREQVEVEHTIRKERDGNEAD